MIETLISGDLFVTPENHAKYNLSKIKNITFGWSPEAVEECQSVSTATFLIDLSIRSSAVQLPSNRVRKGAE